MDRSNTSVADPSNIWMYRVGGISGLLIGLAYIAIIGVYIVVGVLPETGEAWLDLDAGKINAWWAILALSVATDLLILPFMLALYVALQPHIRIEVWQIRIVGD